MNPTDTTICAIATGQGGAIGIIRVSGSNAITYTDNIFRPVKSNKLSEVKAYTLSFGQIVDSDGNAIDDVLVSVFHAPHSYTGENTTEISCHNSPYILQRILQLLLQEGCQLAAPGEYTQRAFLNGKMDLCQAEAVADLIAATSASTHRLALKQMRNGFSQEFKELRDKLLKITSLMELELDFSDHEDLEFADRKDLLVLLNDTKQKIKRLAYSFHYGNAIKNGIPVAIVGDTNVGKSTLLNTLVGEEKAIVSDIKGTTRDSIEDILNINGFLFRFIDTAGIRQTNNEIEKIGIERTYQKIEQSSIILWILDCTTDWKANKEEILSIGQKEDFSLEGKSVLIVCNKCDQLDKTETELLKQELAQIPYPTLLISAKEKQHISELKDELLSLSQLSQWDENEFTVTNLRHYEALTAALKCMERTEHGLLNNIPSDLVSQDLRECLYHLSDIVGEVTSTDILHSIFSHFCVGK